VLSGRGLCDELITHPEESYRLYCVVVCDLETSRMGAPYMYDISRLRVNVNNDNDNSLWSLKYLLRRLHRMTPCCVQSLLQQSFILLLYPCAVFFLLFLDIHYISYSNCPTFLQYGVSVQLHRLLPAFSLLVTLQFH